MFGFSSIAETPFAGLPVTSSGNAVYNVALAEGFTALDSLASGYVVNLSIAEGFTVLDAVSTAASFGVTVAEGFRALDAYSIRGQWDPVVDAQTPVWTNINSAPGTTWHTIPASQSLIAASKYGIAEYGANGVPMAQYVETPTVDSTPTGSWLIVSTQN